MESGHPYAATRFPNEGSGDFRNRTPDPELKRSNLRTLARQLMALHLLAVPHFLLPFLQVPLKILQLLIQVFQVHVSRAQCLLRFLHDGRTQAGEYSLRRF